MSTPTQLIAAHSQRAKLARNVALLALFMGAVACESDNETSVDSSHPIQSSDGGTDAIPEDDADESDSDANDAEVADGGTDSDVGDEADAGGRVTIGEPCESDDDCDDWLFCNGNERCVEATDTGEKVCQAALRNACPAEHLPCDETDNACNCNNPDVDGDNENARACNGEDCDDSDPSCNTGTAEICDEGGRDEDCNAATVGVRDADRDDAIDHLCSNYDPDTGKWTSGPDCDDSRDDVNEDAPELCDNYDNNCNGFIDERTFEDGSFEHENDGLKNTFLLDMDQDEQGDKNSEPELYCIHDAPRRYILATIPQDCKDDNPAVYEGAPEICDGTDNDCDGLVDAEDVVVRQYDFTGTTVVCHNGSWIIPSDGCPEDKLWCPSRGDPIEQGCSRSATLLSSCRACRTHCQFSCGSLGCDDVNHLAIGLEHTCAITTEGRVACWGRGALGRLGIDSARSSSIPELVNGLADATGIAAGKEHTCAIIGPEHLLSCWGSNAFNQLGSADNAVGNFSGVPVSVAGLSTSNRLTSVAQVAAGGAHTCAVLNNGNVACFGSTSDGRLGDGPTTAATSRPVLARRRVFNEILQLEMLTFINDARLAATGEAHTCIVTTGGIVECWGDNSSGQLASNVVANASIARLVDAVDDVEMLAAGAYHTCALSRGQVYCWGENNHFQLGRPREAEEFLPKPIQDLDEVVSISAGGFSTCAVTQDRTVHCWGLSLVRPDPNAPNESPEPTLVPVIPEVRAFTVGPNHACAAGTSQTFCWGQNLFGQLGIGSTTFDPEPMPIPVRAVAGSTK